MTFLHDLILIPLLSLLPCVLWLWYFASQSRYKPIAPRLLGLTFVLGALATLPALLLNLAGQALVTVLFSRTQTSHILVLLLVVAPVEELLKLLVVYAYAYRRPEFDEPLDGVIHSAAAALGFAAVENIVYLSQHSATLVLLRGPLSNPGHALFSAVWGLALSRAKAASNQRGVRFSIIARGWLVAALLHAVFDLLLLAAAHWNLLFFSLLLAAMLALFFWVRGRIHFHRETSPHREGTLLMPTGRTCQACGARRQIGAHCEACNAVITAPDDLILCQVCGTEARPGAKFCARCGANLKLDVKGNLDARPHLIAIAPDGEEVLAFILGDTEIFVGRTLNNAFVIEHPSVSKRHARIAIADGDYIVHDLSSSNGTFVDGRRITEAQLRDGCEVRFGRANFVYRASQATRRVDAALSAGP